VPDCFDLPANPPRGGCSPQSVAGMRRRITSGPEADGHCRISGAPSLRRTARGGYDRAYPAPAVTGSMPKDWRRDHFGGGDASCRITWLGGLKTDAVSTEPRTTGPRCGPAATGYRVRGTTLKRRVVRATIGWPIRHIVGDSASLETTSDHSTPRQEGGQPLVSGPVASKTYGTVSAIRQKEMTGLEFVRGLADGSLPLNTIARTVGYDVTEADLGRVVIVAEPNDTLLNPAGTVHGGFSAILLDSCMGLAIQSTLEKGVALTTLEFKISLVRPITPQTGMLRAEGCVLNRGRRIGTAEGRIVDHRGRLLAHGTTTCLIFDPETPRS
jgi:uncharacterized protein (TIGR00369 family)